MSWNLSLTIYKELMLLQVSYLSLKTISTPYFSFKKSKASALYPEIRVISSIPFSFKNCIWRYTIGIPFTSTKHFARSFVKGRRRVPMPAANIIAFILLFLISKAISHKSEKIIKELHHIFFLNVSFISHPVIIIFYMIARSYSSPM